MQERHGRLADLRPRQQACGGRQGRWQRLWLGSAGECQFATKLPTPVKSYSMLPPLRPAHPAAADHRPTYWPLAAAPAPLSGPPGPSPAQMPPGAAATAGRAAAACCSSLQGGRKAREQGVGRGWAPGEGGGHRARNWSPGRGTHAPWLMASRTQGRPPAPHPRRTRAVPRQGGDAGLGDECCGGRQRHAERVHAKGQHARARRDPQHIHRGAQRPGAGGALHDDCSAHLQARQTERGRVGSSTRAAAGWRAPSAPAAQAAARLPAPRAAHPHCASAARAQRHQNPQHWQQPGPAARGGATHHRSARGCSMHGRGGAACGACMHAAMGAGGCGAVCVWDQGCSASCGAPVACILHRPPSDDG